MIKIILFIPLIFSLALACKDPCVEEANNTEECTTNEESLTQNETDLNQNLFFERPPFVLITEINSKKIAIIGLHAKPDHAVEEVEQLKDVIQNIENRFEISSHILMGDFNLGCNYASQTEIDGLTLRKDTQYIWHIQDSDDTNVAQSRCAYDRIITRNLTATGSVDNRAISHSDHFPVQLEISDLKLAAFNLKQFGQSKLSNQPATVEAIQIICDYDLILLQEIVGEDSPSEELRSKINLVCPTYDYFESDLLGTTTYKERYVYFYKPEKISISESLVVGTPGNAKSKNDTVVDSEEIKIPNSQDPEQISCCKTCKNSQPCGDSCISKSYTCKKTTGCACLWLENIDLLLGADKD